MSKQQQSFAATAAAKRGPSPPSSDQIKKKRRETPTTILSLDPDIVTTIFAFLDMFDLVRCSLVCKLWYFQSFIFLMQPISSSIVTCLSETRTCVRFLEGMPSLSPGRCENSVRGRCTSLLLNLPKSPWGWF